MVHETMAHAAGRAPARASHQARSQVSGDPSRERTRQFLSRLHA